MTFITVQPGFLTLNWLWLGKCYLALGRKEEARKWLKQAAENQRLTSDDKEVCFLSKSSVHFNPIRNSLKKQKPCTEVYISHKLMGIPWAHRTP